MNSKLLIEEPPLQVLPSLACAIGLAEGLVLQQLHYHLRNRLMTEHQDRLADGRYFVEKTYLEWRVQDFPFWSSRTIQRLFEKLERKWKLVSSRPIPQKDNREGKRYTINYDCVRALELGRNPGQIVVGTPDNLSSHPGQNDQGTPDNLSRDLTYKENPMRDGREGEQHSLFGCEDVPESPSDITPDAVREYAPYAFGFLFAAPLPVVSEASPSERSQDLPPTGRFSDPAIWNLLHRLEQVNQGIRFVGNRYREYRLLKEFLRQFTGEEIVVAYQSWRVRRRTSDINLFGKDLPALVAAIRQGAAATSAGREMSLEQQGIELRDYEDE